MPVLGPGWRNQERGTRSSCWEQTTLTLEGGEGPRLGCKERHLKLVLEPGCGCTEGLQCLARNFYPVDTQIQVDLVLAGGIQNWREQQQGKSTKGPGSHRESQDPQLLGPLSHGVTQFSLFWGYFLKSLVNL